MRAAGPRWNSFDLESRGDSWLGLGEILVQVWVAILGGFVLGAVVLQGAWKWLTWLDSCSYPA